ncbi:MAG: ferredoxin [bacterium]
MGDNRFRIRFEADKCIGTGKCAEVAPDYWKLDISEGIAKPKQPTFSEDELDKNLEAARACPAKNGEGVIRIIDQETGEEIY